MAPRKSRKSFFTAESSSSEDEHPATGNKQGTSANFPNAQNTQFRFIALAGDSSSGQESDSKENDGDIDDDEINRSGIVTRPLSSTPLHQSVPRISFATLDNHSKRQRISLVGKQAKGNKDLNKQHNASGSKKAAPVKDRASDKSRPSGSKTRSPVKDRSSDDKSRPSGSKTRSPVKDSSSDDKSRPSGSKTRSPIKNRSSDNKSRPSGSKTRSPVKDRSSDDKSSGSSRHALYSLPSRESPKKMPRRTSVNVQPVKSAIQRKHSPLKHREPLPQQPTNRRKSDSKPRRKKQFNILKEIRRLQKSTDLLIRRMPFVRVVKEIADQTGIRGIRWQGQALLALQDAAEHALVTLFENAYLCCLHCKRVTLHAKDMQLAVRLTGFLD